MPKIIELTVELEIQKVSCPGVWLCQDGRVSLNVFALGTSYQTCMLPPVFPLMFKDVFYFRKRFQESCTLNNICCILKDETIYCELVQWSDDCRSGECTILAQYLGALNDVLFPPNMCSNEGVDLLMRRSKDFPGILSPKIEIATKVRIDEVWDQPSNMKSVKVTSCHCTPDSEARQRQVCHSAQYHRNKCTKRPPSVTRSGSRSRSRSRSGGSRSCCSLTQEPEPNLNCECRTSKNTKKPSEATRSGSRSQSQPHSDGSSTDRSSTQKQKTVVNCECQTPTKSRTSLFRNLRSPRRRQQYNVYNVETHVAADWPRDTGLEDDYTRYRVQVQTPKRQD
ncbi:hypothetical protein ABMA28_015412 [Loxostege sticticalis]|uniref:Spermatogenesis-associated protein 6 N-terminal domain-containing protein n=1 Tax=Loxostege sticticalis TaxID=481309 RepID=A0ABD0TAE3_LOXSC